MVDSHSIEFLYRRKLDGSEIFISCSADCLSEYCKFHSYSQVLEMFGFCIPSEITYCLAQNDKYKLKYRIFGGSIHFFVSDAW